MADWLDRKDNVEELEATVDGLDRKVHKLTEQLAEAKAARKSAQAELSAARSEKRKAKQSGKRGTSARAGSAQAKGSI